MRAGEDAEEKARIQGNYQQMSWAWSTPGPEHSSMDVLKEETNAFPPTPFWPWDLTAMTSVPDIPTLTPDLLKSMMWAPFPFVTLQ